MSKGSYDMFRRIALLVATLAFAALCTASDGTENVRAATESAPIFGQDVPARSPDFLPSLGLTSPAGAVAQQACCKICTRGKACGNTCISQDKVCHVGPGCACNG